MRMRKWLCLLLGLMLLAPAALGEEYPPQEYEFTHKAYLTYESESLKYRIETFLVHGVRCYLTKVWVRDPGSQIRKAQADWGQNIQLPREMVLQIPAAVVAINGSGYWSPTYPDVPENYPGQVSDYYYTPWGSLTVTDGQVLRNVEELPYYGLTAEADGLRMYAGTPTGEVLAGAPAQTWSFRDFCPMQRDGEILTPEDWDFAGRKARRTVIGRVNRNNYLILSVSDEGGLGLTLHEVNGFFQKYFQTEWLYNLDGGPSSALMVRKQGAKKLRTVMGGAAKDMDLLVFAEAE